MAAETIGNLPSELVRELAEHLPVEELKALSLTNSVNRQLLIPELFKVVKVICEWDRDVDNRHLIKYARFVQHLHIRVILRSGLVKKAYAGHAGGMSVWGTSPQTAEANRSLIRGGLPHCVAFTIAFDLVHIRQIPNRKIDNWHETVYTSRTGIHVVDPQVTLAVARKNNEAACDEVWRDISDNMKIKRLDVKNMPHEVTNAWKTPWWRCFMGRLKELNIGIWGKHDSVDDPDASLKAQDIFVEALEKNFLAHAKSVERSSFTGTLAGKVVWGPYPYSVLPLNRNHLPRLRVLQLEDVIVGANLLRILEGWGDGLKELHLWNCVSAYGETDVHGRYPAWYEFWGFVRANNRGLTRVSYGTFDPVRSSKRLASKIKWRHRRLVEPPARLRDTRILWKYAIPVSVDPYAEDEWSVVKGRSEKDDAGFWQLLDEVEQRRRYLEIGTG